jgi:hypothetical protein
VLASCGKGKEQPPPASKDASATAAKSRVAASEKLRQVLGKLPKHPATFGPFADMKLLAHPIADVDKAFVSAFGGRHGDFPGSFRVSAATARWQWSQDTINQLTIQFDKGSDAADVLSEHWGPPLRAPDNIDSPPPRATTSW